MILKLSYALKLLRKQEFFFFLNDVIDFDEQLTTMFETKEKKHNKSIIIKVCVDEMTTKLQ